MKPCGIMDWVIWEESVKFWCLSLLRMSEWHRFVFPFLLLVFLCLNLPDCAALIGGVNVLY